MAGKVSRNMHHFQGFMKFVTHISPLLNLYALQCVHVCVCVCFVKKSKISNAP